jgi:hypothetical protein
MTFRRILAVLAFSMVGWAQTADTILDAARAALGGGKLTAVQSLAVSGSLEKRDARGVRHALVELSLQLPGQFLREITPADAGPAVQIQCLNGDTGWSRTIFPPGTTVNGAPPPDRAADLDEAGRNSLNREFVRYLLAFLVTGTPDFPLTFRAGDAMETDRGTMDTVEGRGADGFLVRLLFDPKTHRPSAIVYSSSAQLWLSDYREENGMLLPHQLTTTTDGIPTEKFEIKKFKVNPLFPASQFRP